MNSRSAKLLAVLETSNLQHRAQDILDKAGIPKETYHLRDYGLDVKSPEHASKIIAALMSAGVKAVGDNTGKILFSTQTELGA